MTERFEPTDAIAVESIEKKMYEYLRAEKEQEFFEHNIVRPMYAIGRQTQCGNDQQREEDRVCKAAMGQQVLGGAQPESSKKIHVRHALCQSAPEQGLLAKTFFKECLAYAGADCYVGEGVQ